MELPTTEDIRRARHDAAKTAAERAELARTPLLAVLGAGELAVTAVSKAVAEARTRATTARERATAQAEGVQHRVAELPQHLTTDELRKAVAQVRAQAERAYADFADQGEQTWGRIRTQPQVREALARIGGYTEKLDARVDAVVDDAHDAAERALGVVGTQTRSTGERVARATQRFSARTADAADAAAADVAEPKAGESKAAESNGVAGAETASEGHATTKPANRTAPKVVPKNAAGRPTVRRSGPANGSKPTG